MDNHSNSLIGKCAVVTGSTTGIGRATAVELARRGADIIIHGRQATQRSDQVIQEIKALDRRCQPVFQDFAEPFCANDFVKSAAECLGGFDLWINNAGADVLTGDAADWSVQKKLSHLFKTDVESTLLLSRAAGRLMAESNAKAGGSIINIGWDQAYQGMAGDSGEIFATTKGAIMSMTKSLALSLAPQVRVNCVAAGWIQTKWGEATSEYWDQRARRESLMDRWGRPEDIANTIAFLCSDNASFISGQIINVNGGFNFAGE